MTARLPKLIRRLRTAARTIAQALVSAVRGRMLRLLVDLYRAIDSRQAVRIGYVKSDGERSTRVIEPHELIVTNAGNITVVAFDQRDGEDTTFRVDRITSADFQTQAQPTARPAEQGVTVPFTFNLDTAVSRALATPQQFDDRCAACSAEAGEPCTIECRTDGLKDEIKAYATEYIEHRRLAAARTLGYDNSYAHAAYGQDLARMLGAPEMRGQELQDAAEATLAALDARVTQLVAVATATGDPVLTAVTHCVYGPGVLAGCA